MPSQADSTMLVPQLRDAGFRFLAAGETRQLLPGAVSREAAWAAFAASWEGMPLDTYMADGGRYRRRRHAVFSSVPGADPHRQPDAPHYQSLDYNALNGGIARWFEPVPASITESPLFRAILAWCQGLFDEMAPNTRWHIEMHQFRIEAKADTPGLPTPEGAHRDGVDWVLVMLIARRNIASGTTTVYDHTGRALGSFTLTEPLDAALVDDRRVFHGVTAVEAVGPGERSYRDVLVLTFKRSSEG